jgi:hypothetical protein
MALDQTMAELMDILLMITKERLIFISSKQLIATVQSK